jgi:hypothetical protein
MPISQTNLNRQFWPSESIAHDRRARRDSFRSYQLHTYKFSAKVVDFSSACLAGSVHLNLAFLIPFCWVYPKNGCSNYPLSCESHCFKQTCAGWQINVVCVIAANIIPVDTQQVLVNKDLLRVHDGLAAEKALADSQLEKQALDRLFELT